MRSNYIILVFIIWFACGCTQKSEILTKELHQAMNGLSATTATNGMGADAYGKFLADDFTRWTLGSKLINTKESWVEGIHEWYDDGWRVSKRDIEEVDLIIRNDLAFSRRIITETYLGPKGDTSDSKAALAEVWVYRANTWLLLRVNVQVLAIE